MKKIMLGLTLLGLVASATAVEKSELDDRIHALTAKFEALQFKPDKRIPADILRKAQGIILLDRTKAGFIFAYQGGSGLALVKEPASGKWSPAAFLAANEASLGFQIGGEQNFFVILLLNTNSAHRLTEPNFNFGGEARGTAGNTSAGKEGSLTTGDPVIVYGDRQGLFGGAAIKGGAISPDEEANRIYYGQFVTMRDILFDKKVKPTEPASKLAAKLAEFSKNAGK